MPRRQVSYQSQVLAFCRDLVRIPSLSGQEADVADRVAQEMTLLGYDRIARDAMGNVIGVVEGNAGSTVLFDAHMDTVPVTSPETWRWPAHSGELIDGRVWGRGATDTKGSLAAALYAVGSFAGRGNRSKRPTLIMAATVGEEMIEGIALASVLEHYRPDAVVVCEPTGLRLGIGHKGRAGVVLEAQGKAAHSSRPENGVNAAYLMTEAIQTIRRRPAQSHPLLGSSVRELTELVSRPFPGTSMVPEGCSARFDCRLLPGETPEGLLGDFRRIPHSECFDVRLHRGVLRCYTGLSHDVPDFHAAWYLDAGHAVVQSALRALQAAGLGTTPWVAPYCTNGATSAGEYGLPTLVYGAGDIAAAHVVDESLAVEALERAFVGYQALAGSLCIG